MDTSGVSIKDIIKKFDLPERQTKINSIFKMQTQAPLYCSCRSADINNRFMIMCDKCGEWFHGDCIGMKEKDSKFIEKWFCCECIKVYGLKIKYKSYNSSLKKKKIKKPTLFNKNGDQDSENTQCGQCSNCLQNEECGNKNFKFPPKYLNNYKKKPQIDVNSRNINTQPNDTYLDGTINKKLKLVRKPFRELVRCYGPDCYKRARINSKYCGDECGLALAKLRLVSILPSRITEQTPSKADQIDRAKLDEIKLQKMIIVQKLKNNDLKEKELRTLIETVKKLPIVDSGCDLTENNRTKIDCILCGWPVPSVSAKKHFEICFKKMEGQFKAFVSYESNRGSKIFCDSYDTKNGTYCKYLRSICPDHNKPEKVNENEVCGCPIVKTLSLDMFSNADSYCQESKQKCDLHYNWENTAIAEIDFEYLKEMNKLNQLAAEQGIILQRLTNRLGALGILLNCTMPNFK